MTSSVHGCLECSQHHRYGKPAAVIQNSQLRVEHVNNPQRLHSRKEEAPAPVQDFKTPRPVCALLKPAAAAEPPDGPVNRFPLHARLNAFAMRTARMVRMGHPER